MQSFSEFQLPAALQEAIDALGYKEPTPVQAASFPLLVQGRDLLATAQTGTGKTAAFALPLLKNMIESGKAKPVLILTPTRELAEQIGAVLDQLTERARRFKPAVVIGGTSYYKQTKELRQKPMFIVGTPGRLLDQTELKNLDLSSIATVVLDEADRLLDMGFAPQIDQLIKGTPATRQTLLFSATLPEAIEKMAAKYMNDPARIAIGAVTKPVDRIKQDVIKTTVAGKNQMLLDELDKVAGSILVFARTKSRTERLAKFLSDSGHVVGRIHGDRSQKQRSDAIAAFREGKIRILVATDIASRGIDIPHIQHVVNFDLPMAPEDYIHRIGRTARAGAEGHSLAFVTPEDALVWAKIYKLIHGKYPDKSELPQGKRMTGPSGVKQAFAKNGRGPNRGFDGPTKRGHERPFPGARKKQNAFGGPNRSDRRAADGISRKPFKHERPFEELGNREEKRPIGKKPFNERGNDGERRSSESDKPFGKKSFGGGKPFGKKPFGGAPKKRRNGDRFVGSGGKPGGHKSRSGDRFDVKG